MTFDFGGVLRARFDDIGVQRALNEELGVVETAFGIFKNTNEQFADCFALFFRVGKTSETFKETITRTHMDQFNALMALECFNDLFAFAETHEARVDKHTCELRTDCLVHERSRNGGIDATGQPTNGATAAHLGANQFDLRVDD